MELIPDKSAESSSNVPKLSMSTFEIKNNYYVVTDGRTFNYYVIKAYPDKITSPIIRFEKSPPVLLEGVAIIDKKVYHVTVNDLLRRVIRKSREVIQEAQDARTTRNPSKSKSTSDFTAASKPSPLQSTNESGTSSETELEIAKASDIAWKDQIGTLLDHLSAQEGFNSEWEFTENL